MSQITVEDLIGSASLIEVQDFKLEPKHSSIKEKFLILKHSDKKVLAITTIAMAMVFVK